MNRVSPSKPTNPSLYLLFHQERSSKAEGGEEGGGEGQEREQRGSQEGEERRSIAGSTDQPGVQPFPWTWRSWWTSWWSRQRSRSAHQQGSIAADSQRKAAASDATRSQDQQGQDCRESCSAGGGCKWCIIGQYYVELLAELSSLMVIFVIGFWVLGIGYF